MRNLSFLFNVSAYEYSLDWLRPSAVTIFGKRGPKKDLFCRGKFPFQKGMVGESSPLTGAVLRPCCNAGLTATFCGGFGASFAFATLVGYMYKFTTKFYPLGMHSPPGMLLAITLGSIAFVLVLIATSLQCCECGKNWVGPAFTMLFGLLFQSSTFLFHLPFKGKFTYSTRECNRLCLFSSTCSLECQKCATAPRVPPFSRRVALDSSLRSEIRACVAGTRNCRIPSTPTLCGRPS